MITGKIKVEIYRFGKDSPFLANTAIIRLDELFSDYKTFCDYYIGYLLQELNYPSHLKLLLYKEDSLLFTYTTPPFTDYNERCNFEAHVIGIYTDISHRIYLRDNANTGVHKRMIAELASLARC